MTSIRITPIRMMTMITRRRNQTATKEVLLIQKGTGLEGLPILSSITAITRRETRDRTRTTITMKRMLLRTKMQARRRVRSTGS